MWDMNMDLEARDPQLRGGIGERIIMSLGDVRQFSERMPGGIPIVAPEIPNLPLVFLLLPPLCFPSASRLIRFVLPGGLDNAISPGARGTDVKSENPEGAKSSLSFGRRARKLADLQVFRTLTRRVRSPPANIAFLVSIRVCELRV